MFSSMITIVTSCAYITFVYTVDREIFMLKIIRVKNVCVDKFYGSFDP